MTAAVRKGAPVLRQPVFRLPVSWRLPPSAAGIISSAFYPFAGFQAGTEPGARRLEFTAAGMRGALDDTLDTAARTGWALHELPARHTARTDSEAAAAAAALAARLISRGAVTSCERHPGGKVLTPAGIAIGVTHRDQAQQVRQALAETAPAIAGQVGSTPRTACRAPSTRSPSSSTPSAGGTTRPRSTSRPGGCASWRPGTGTRASSSPGLASRGSSTPTRPASRPIPGSGPSSPTAGKPTTRCSRTCSGSARPERPARARVLALALPRMPVHSPAGQESRMTPACRQAPGQSRARRA